MKRHALPAVVAMLALAACDTQTPVGPEGEAPTPMLSVVDGSSQLLASGLPVIAGAESLLAAADQRYIARINGSAAQFSAEVEALGGEVTLLHKGAGIAVVGGLTPEAAEGLATSRVAREVVKDEVLLQSPPVGTSQPAAASVASPSDPAGAYFYPRQWHMRAIEADQAWAAGKLGSEDVTVAILDTGIDYLHADLAGRVDLARSVSFIPIDDLYANFYFPDRHPITDIGYHGTHVAATVASNGYVGAGVTSNTTLIGAKVCSVVTGGCPSSAIIAGILHAVDSGADVINMSLGGFLFKQGSGQTVGYYNNLFNYARRNGVTVVLAAGNERADLDHYNNTTATINGVVYTLSPATFKTYCDASNVICVSATGPTNYSLTEWENVDAPASYTNYGRSAISVAAPGGNASYVYAACSSSSLLIPGCQASNGFIVGVAGTSMASPHTAGLAALLVAEGYDPAQVRARVQQSADDLGQSGTDPYYGKGRINVANALGL